MSEAIVFDTHKFVRRLTEAGLDEAVAEALAEEQIHLLNANLATKQNLADTEARLDIKIAEIHHEIAEVEARLRQDIAETKVDLLKTKVDLLKWMFAALVAQAGIIIGVLKLT